MSPTQLKPLLSQSFGLILGGAFMMLITTPVVIIFKGWKFDLSFETLFFIGFLCWNFFASKWILLGFYTAFTRSRRILCVSDEGITFPETSQIQPRHIDAADITDIRKYDTLQGRRIEIQLHDGQSCIFDVAPWSSQDAFLELCELHRLLRRALG